MDYQVNCHSHSDGSFLDGLSSVKDIVQRVVELDQQYAVVTDHGEVNNHLSLARECKNAGIGYVLGMEGYWLTDKRLNKAREDKKYPHPSHICFLAQNNVGLSNLWSLSTEAYLGPQFYHKPIVTPEIMAKYSEGLWASDACMLTDFAQAIFDGNEDVALQQIGVLLDIFKDRFYMELHTWQFMNPSTDEHRSLNRKMTELNQAKLRIARQLGVPLVVVNDSHHSRPEQWEDRERLWQFSTTTRDDNVNARGVVTDDLRRADHHMSSEENIYWLERHGIPPDVTEEAIQNSYAIAQKCSGFDIGKTLGMPRLYRTDEEDVLALVQACEKGFTKFVLERGLDPEPYFERLQEELDLIVERKFCGYFNIVRECVMAFREGTWAKYVEGTNEKKPMLIGPGRGSAGSSLVAYLLGIHQVDPIRYGTLFSRFLSPGRKGYPDIDIDVPRNYRPQAISYLSQRFGQDNICTIGLVQRSQAKRTIKDVGKAMGIPFADLNAITDAIQKLELDESGEIDLEANGLSEWRVKYQELFDKVPGLLGIARHSGAHPSGIIISDTPVRGRVPLRKAKNSVITTQFEMGDVEELGGVKFDWLGLRHLDTMQAARNIIYETQNVWLDYDGAGIGIPPGVDKVITFDESFYEDESIWHDIDLGYTTGIFQVETPSSTEAAIHYRCRNHIDVANLTAIVRPGVADAGLKDVIMDRRSGKSPVVYDHPLMKKFVGPDWATDTYGVIVYQEQILQCVQEMAGFTADESDDLRKAIGKKIMDKVLSFKSKFINGCLANPEFMNLCPNKTERVVVHTLEKIWESIEAAGNYSFNYSHAIEYGAFISSREIWTRHHFPAEYIAALLQTDEDNKSVSRYVREARRRGIRILGPDVNFSDVRFSIRHGDIRYGLSSVRDVGEIAAQAIVNNAPYTSFSDFLDRAGKGTGKSEVINLISIGAFDSLGQRHDLMNELLRHRAKSGLSDSTLSNESKLAMTIERRLQKPQYQIDIPDFSDPLVLARLEKELLGVYVSHSPMDMYNDLIEGVALDDPLAIQRLDKGQKFVVAGEITSVRKTVTKKGKNPGQEMAHVTLLWKESEFSTVAFPRVWCSAKTLLQVGSPVACEATKLDSGYCIEGVQRLDFIVERAARENEKCGYPA